jgi:type IV fimbrial biogenesis protein FimT
MKMLSTHGFTLIELMTTIGVVALTVTLAMPSMKTAIRNNRLAGAANQFVSALSLARSESVKRGMHVTVGKTSTNWEQGWRVFTDNSTYGTFDGSDEVIRVYPALPASYTLRGNNNVSNYISFLASGESNQLGSFALCDNSDGRNTPQSGTSRLIIVNRVGRVRLGIDSDHNGIPEDDDANDLSSCTSP